MLVTQNMKEKLRIAEQLFQAISNKYRKHRTDKDDPIWVTISGAHVPLSKNKEVIGGPLKGQKFQYAQSGGGGSSKGTQKQGRQQSESSKYPDVATVEDLKAAIKSGRIKMVMNNQKQSKHRKGTKAYNDAVAKGDFVGTFNISDEKLDALIKAKSGSGDIYMNKKDGHIKETFDCGEVLADYAALSGAMYETTRITVHHSKNGYHAVPASSKGRKGK